MEESASDSAEWSGEDTDESACEEEAETPEGAGEVGKTPTETAVNSEGSGADNGLEGSTAGGGATSDATPEDADATGAGGRHGAEKRDRERVSGQPENLAGESSGVGEGEGGSVIVPSARWNLLPPGTLTRRTYTAM